MCMFSFCLYAACVDYSSYITMTQAALTDDIVLAEALTHPGPCGDSPHITRLDWLESANQLAGCPDGRMNELPLGLQVPYTCLPKITWRE